MYTAEEKQAIEQVICIFQDYWQHAQNIYGQPSCEIVWLNNLQCYLLLLNYSMTENVKENNLLAIPIQSAKELYAELIHELVHEAYFNYNFAELHPTELSEELMHKVQNEIIERITPYLQGLPEYYELALQTVIEHGKIYTDGGKILKEITKNRKITLETYRMNFNRGTTYMYGTFSNRKMRR